MNDVFEEVMTHITAASTGIRFINWDIGQLSGFYLKPGVSFPCALISFPQIKYEDLSDQIQMGDTFMQIKLATESLSNTSNLTPLQVRHKGNEIWDIERLLTKSLQGKNGISHNSMTRVSIKKEEREDGINVLNIVYTFMKQDYTNQPTKHFVSQVKFELLKFINDGSLILRKVSDYATFNSDMWLNTFTTEMKAKYAYQIISCSFNGNPVDMGEKQTFNTTNQTDVPVQSAPYNTIPAHNIDDPYGMHLTYDQNWIEFLTSNPISEFLTFRPSPWKQYLDGGSGYTGEQNYPIDNLRANMFILGEFSDITVYGEGFQIDCLLTDTFSIEVEYSYIDHANNEVAAHTIEFTEAGMYIDGAYIPAAHTKIYSV